MEFIATHNPPRTAILTLTAPCYRYFNKRTSTYWLLLLSLFDHFFKCLRDHCFCSS